MVQVHAVSEFAFVEFQDIPVGETFSTRGFMDDHKPYVLVKKFSADQASTKEGDVKKFQPKDSCRVFSDSKAAINYKTRISQAPAKPATALRAVANDRGSQPQQQLSSRPAFARTAPATPAIPVEPRAAGNSRLESTLRHIHSVERHHNRKVAAAHAHAGAASEEGKEVDGVLIGAAADAWVSSDERHGGGRVKYESGYYVGKFSQVKDGTFFYPTIFNGKGKGRMSNEEHVKLGEDRKQPVETPNARDWSPADSDEPIFIAVKDVKDAVKPGMDFHL